ncbi:hypothetical protein MYP_4762 [Sporocytophaga myxococcoides]|uniref:DUF58 domain-containing protein n=1 Tax=Sporocytophaga myxococcoides TaxID=153721 RepID=A0A098LMD1_9BACT|nr:DUF58 domain-containing protein [Sporocytophaga myxococcoides]GAL87532.1 hypothetical protein MYP_4762 [Sporocytophaga myxococcoides]
MNLDLNAIRQFGNIEFLAKQMVEGFITGLHKSPYHGFSVEFAEHRLYNTGESTRHIDWKVYGKTDRLYTKRYEEETNLRCLLLIDTSSSMFYPEKNLGKITFGTMAAASLAYLLQNQRDAVGLCTFSEDIEILTPIKSTPSHLHSVFLQLENLLKEKHNEKKSGVASVIHQIADKINKRSLVIIFSDMLENRGDKDSIFPALQHLKHNNHEVLLFHVIDSKTEEEFNFEERPYEFIDIEKGQKVKINPSQVKDAYLSATRQYFEDIKLKAGQYKIDFIKADINNGFDQILLNYLIKRNKMK